MSEPRVCKRCGAIKAEIAFSFKRGASGVRDTWCKQCVKRWKVRWHWVNSGCRSMVAVKRCKKCGTVKPSSDFFPSKKRPDGLTLWCKICLKAQAKVDAAKRANGKGKGKGNIVTPLAVQDSNSILHRLADDTRVATAVIKMIARKEAMRVRGSAKQYCCVRCNAQASSWHHISYAEVHWTQVVPVCAKCHKAHHAGKLREPLSESDVPRWV